MGCAGHDRRRGVAGTPLGRPGRPGPHRFRHPRRCDRPYRRADRLAGRRAAAATHRPDTNDRAAAHATGHRPRHPPRCQRGTLRTGRAPRGHRRGRSQRMDPPAGTDPVRDPGPPGARRPARPVRGHLICVGVLGRHKGQDLLVEALADLAERDWRCLLAGPLDRDPDFVEQLQTRITRLGYGHRVRLSGVLTGAALSHAYTTADLLVAPSRSETYGMTVTEALAHGLPVVAAAVGGLPEALGCTADGTRPGQLVPPGDPAALAAALRDWLGDERHRRRLRAAARQRRSTLRGWEQTTQEIANALTASGCRKPAAAGVDNHQEKTRGR